MIENSGPDMSEARCIPSDAGAAGPTRQLAQFAASLRFAQLPGEVVSKTKLCLLDTLGCCIFGASLPQVQKLATMVAAEGCAANASAFGLPLRTSPALAALLNGTSAHAFQLDEIHLESTLHPGSLALPAAFSLAEVDRTAGGRDLITAIVAGSQAAGLMAVQDGAMTKSFHS